MAVELQSYSLMSSIHCTARAIRPLNGILAIAATLVRVGGALTAAIAAADEELLLLGDALAPEDALTAALATADGKLLLLGDAPAPEDAPTDAIAASPDDLSL